MSGTNIIAQFVMSLNFVLSLHLHIICASIARRSGDSSEHCFVK